MSEVGRSPSGAVRAMRASADRPPPPHDSGSRFPGSRCVGRAAALDRSLGDRSPIGPDAFEAAANAPGPPRLSRRRPRWTVRS
ncbi:MAG: hypothetical protein OXU70_00005, partial [Gammaproteobacteria bacterium]|nr:hypothetical protein [Gammaproteobacteria bacterium]